MKIFDFVKKERKNKGNRKPYYKIENVKHQSISESTPERSIADELLKIFKAAPFVTKDTVPCPVSAEGNNVTCHRNISDYDIIDYRNSQQKIILPVLAHITLKLQTFCRIFNFFI